MPRNARTRTRTLAVAVGTAALVATGASAASATTLSNSSGPLTDGSAVSGQLASAATIITAVGNASCSTGTLGGTVTNNGAAAVDLTSPMFTLGSCTDTISPFNITGIVLQSVSTARMTASSGGGTLRVTNATIRLGITSGGLPGSCTMVMNTVTGAVANADSSVTFTGVPISSAAGFCGTTLPWSLSAKFRPMESGGSAVSVAP